MTRIYETTHNKYSKVFYVFQILPYWQTASTSAQCRKTTKFGQKYLLYKKSRMPNLKRLLPAAPPSRTLLQVQRNLSSPRLKWKGKPPWSPQIYQKVVTFHSFFMSVNLSNFNCTNVIHVVHTAMPCFNTV